MNKAQGQSSNKCGMLLPKQLWTHDQIYVALSRCGNQKSKQYFCVGRTGVI